MNAFREHHENSIRFGYRCFDRILLNGLIQPFQQPERVVGFFNTYRELYPVSRAVLRDIATQYKNWATAHATRWGAPNPNQTGPRGQDNEARLTVSRKGGLPECLVRSSSRPVSLLRPPEYPPTLFGRI